MVPQVTSLQDIQFIIECLVRAVRKLVRQLIHLFKSQDCDMTKSLVDSMPIVTCAGKNKPSKVATEITSKRYCSTMNMYCSE